MWRRKSELSCVINMFSALARPTRFVTASIERLVSNWYSRGGCHPCTHSGEPAIMRRRNKSLENLIIARASTPGLLCVAALTALVPLFISAQQSKPAAPDDADAIFTTDTRLVPLNVT